MRARPFSFGLFKCIAASYASLDINGDGVYALASIGISPHFYRMLPYLITIIVLAFTSKSSAPKAEGIPDKGAQDNVALESTIISPRYALSQERGDRPSGRADHTRLRRDSPPTIAVIGGRLKAGLSRDEIEYLGKTGRGVAKASRRDLPALVARGLTAPPPSPPP